MPNIANSISAFRLASIAIAALCTCAVAEDAPSKIEYQTEQTPQSPTLNWLVNTRNYWGKIVGDTGKRLDGFFAGEEVIEGTNDSFLKLGFEFQQFKSSRSYLDPKLKFRLDLPTVEEKLRIVFESEPAEQTSIAEENNAQAINRDSSDPNDSAVGALDLELKAKRNWSVNTGVGARIGKPIDPFWRLRLRGDYAINREWTISSRDSIYYFHEDGWGARADVSFQYNQPTYVLRQKTDGRYFYSDRRWEWVHTYSYIKELSPIRAINYQIGVIAQTQADVQTTGYFIHAIYRRKLHKEWLFYEMIPELYFPREENWDYSPSLTIKLEMVLSGEQQ